MKKAAVVGHFAFGLEYLDGQTIKTKTVTTELEKQLGADQVVKIDTHGGAKALPKITVQLISAFKNYENIIIFPAHNGIRVFAPLCSTLNKVFHRKLHYVVIGGWLPTLLQNHKQLAEYLKSFHGIYVETKTMKKALVEQGFSNILVMPNFKKLNILEESQLVYQHSEPYKLCTFSRVMREKGIEDAVNAVEAVNEYFGRIVYTLDIYGQVDSEQVTWFDELKDSFSACVHYGGLVPFDKSPEVLKNYFAVLFPTYYEGEGFAGTLIDALAAGVPVIASDWRYNPEIVEDGMTGIIHKAQNELSLRESLKWAYQNQDLWNSMKNNCIRLAYQYLPEKVIEILCNQIV